MKLSDIGYIKRIMAENGAYFKKKFGQNFLTSDAALDKIAENAEEGVLEIGPGIGTLTERLCERAKKVVSIEIDRELVPILEKTMAGHDNFKLICADALKIDIPELIDAEFPGMTVSVCANLPYYITTPVLTRLLENSERFANVTVMVQKEVAARLTAQPGAPDYGAITVFTAYYGTAKRIAKVPAGSFVPAPKVDSAVVRIDVHRAPPVNCPPDALFRCVRAAFGQRRKTLSNALRTGYPELSREEIDRALVTCGISPAARGETLSLAQFAAIAKELGTK